MDPWFEQRVGESSRYKLPLPTISLMAAVITNSEVVVIERGTEWRDQGVYRWRDLCLSTLVLFGLPKLVQEEI